MFRTMCCAAFHIASLAIASLFVPSLVILSGGNPARATHLEAHRPDRRRTR
jgi:hypothetical protein